MGRDDWAMPSRGRVVQRARPNRYRKRKPFVGPLFIAERRARARGKRRHARVALATEPHFCVGARRPFVKLK